MTGHNKHITTPAWVGRWARWLELHAIALTPEHFHLDDGGRAAFIVAVPLLLIIATGKSQFGWAIFAAFWTCLADTGGPEKTRRALLCSFVALGSVAALVGSHIAGLGTFAGLSAGPALVVLTALLPLRWPAATLVATLLGVVAVVAAGFPAWAFHVRHLHYRAFARGSRRSLGE
ncbi:hypothetical protein IVB56_09745 [Bradyrhizobium sp. CW7]|uniref:hypothetical protein n=1 Tax=Bradyrhizobium sp. CW7 TaxID=2782688 RepID=UPI001FFAF7F4|nr:hypothetical protein [Bradyrhizobium sp. CW7]MCK1351388.1 hypothetical protein [Bradyrhizobium sp. CW7]